MRHGISAQRGQKVLAVVREQPMFAVAVLDKVKRDGRDEVQDQVPCELQVREEFW